MGETTFIGVGSNLGDKLDNCRKAIDRVGGISGCRLTGQSDFFRTSPVGVEGHGWYVNAVISIESDITAHQLLKSLLAIETDLGRKRNHKWDPRTIDLDILLYGQVVMDVKDLTIPHPYMHLRKFVLLPMSQLITDLVHPVLGKTIVELLGDLAEDGQVVFPMGAD